MDDLFDAVVEGGLCGLGGRDALGAGHHGEEGLSWGDELGGVCGEDMEEVGLVEDVQQFRRQRAHRGSH